MEINTFYSNYFRQLSKKQTGKFNEEQLKDFANAWCHFQNIGLIKELNRLKIQMKRLNY